MEIGIRSEMHTYSGGLGILAGDVARSAADLGLPMVFVTLASRDGYLRQELDQQGRAGGPRRPLGAGRVGDAARPPCRVELEGRDGLDPGLAARDGLARWAATVPVLLLDTDLEQNDHRDRSITNRLYGGDEVQRLKQEAVLGFGGHRILDALGFDDRDLPPQRGARGLPAASRSCCAAAAMWTAARPLDEPLYDEEAVRAPMRVHHPHAGRGGSRPVRLCRRRARPGRHSSM